MVERERRPRREQAAKKVRPNPSRPGRSAGDRASIARWSQLDWAVGLIDRICRVAGNPNLIKEARRRLARRGVPMAIHRHDSAVLFDWLAEAISFRGIADSVAYSYIQQHGSAQWQDIAARFSGRPSCPKLTSYW